MFTAIIPFQYAYRKDAITGFHVRNTSNKLWHSINRNKTLYLPSEAFGEPKVIKWSKEWAIPMEGYSGYSYRGLFCSNIPFW